MTAETVHISITIKAGEKTAEIIKTIDVQDLEKETASLGLELNGQIFRLALELLDEHLRGSVPGNWKNVGRERRSLVFEHGNVHYNRRIYMDDKGRRRKPLDELLDVQVYARNSRTVQEIGSVMAAETTYRKAANMLSYMLKTSFSPSSIQRMVKQTGQGIIEQEGATLSTQAGSIAAPVLYGEADGVWIHLQRERQKKVEVKVAVMYTGKKRIGKQRFRCENKITMTQLGGSTRDWQAKLRELADSTYNLEGTQLMVTGGDGSSWVKQSFDLFNLPQTHLLDRFHVVRAVNRSFGQDLEVSKSLRSLFTDGFEAIVDDLQNCILNAKGKKKDQMMQTYNYLWNNQEALVDLDQRGFSDLTFCTMGSIEGNVDKLVVHRMEGRGCCWRMDGARSMLAVLRHKEELQHHCFHYRAIPRGKKPVNRVKPTLDQQSYRPVSGSLPIFHGCDQSKPWVQLLRHKLNSGLSINAFV